MTRNLTIRNFQETSQKELANRILKENLRNLKLQTLNKNKKKQEKENLRNRKEIFNIISILLDKGLSLKERLRRAGMSSANSDIAKDFKKEIIKCINKEQKKLDKIPNDSLKKGILGIKLEDFNLNTIKSSIKKTLTNSTNNKRNKSLNNSFKELKSNNKSILLKKNIKININKKINLRNKKLQIPAFKLPNSLNAFKTSKTDINSNNLSKSPTFAHLEAQNKKNISSSFSSPSI